MCPALQETARCHKTRCEFYSADIVWAGGALRYNCDAGGQNTGGREVWKRPLESRKKLSETWLSDQAGAVGTGYTDLCLGAGAWSPQQSGSIGELLGGNWAVSGSAFCSE